MTHVSPLPELTAAVIAAARAHAHAVPEADAVAAVERELQAAEYRREEREARRERRWAPSWRCDRCHSFTSSATAACPQCGHVGSSNDEGHRTSARARRRGRR